MPRFWSTVIEERIGSARVLGVDIINGQITLPGAQPPHAFLDAFNQALGSK
jgi:predicted DsbA family dithiol-disulfide isomerase